MRITFRFLAAALGFALLSGCFLAPGKFVSEMTISKSGDFTFNYKGEIWVLGLSGLLDIGRQASEADFKPKCYDDETGEERECTEAEAEEQLSDEKADNAQMAETFRGLLGGLDPNDPETIDAFVERVEKQKGWESVEHKGNGIFEVDFSVTGPMSHDFQFPTIDKVASFGPFVSMNIRKDNKVRVSAPGFAKDDQGGELAGLGAAFGGALGANPDNAGIPSIAVLDGSFTIRTDGEILTNNTEEGPETDPETGDKILTWKIDATTASPPEALIAFK